MKKFIILFALLPLCLAGCGMEPPTVSESFSVTFSAPYNGLDLSGELTHGSEGTHLTLSEPYTVAGMGFDYADEAVTIRRGGSQTHADSGYLPDAALPSRVYQALLYLSQAQYAGSENGVDTFTVPTPQGEAVLTAEKGIPLSLTLPADGTQMRFEPTTE